MLGFPPGVLAGFVALFHLRRGRERDRAQWAVQGTQGMLAGGWECLSATELIYPQETPGHLRFVLGSLTWALPGSLPWLCLGGTKSQLQQLPNLALQNQSSRTGVLILLGWGS